MLAPKHCTVDRRTATGAERLGKKRVLVAKPQSDHIDTDAVIEKVMTRFPKVLAHLAK